ncbi:hypothetical protein N658DRAFT_490883 [Parathielavia hyrcaniae]|uniref:Uncharacterized protein n=1 Tax=Parathielavia hyrcaniae TaxID=113614 RepID=A0AAN6Q9V5_9PEZI|nr:hypothetical protein N658DRAFT_490883 [Parathielavia hyrcaniae]
MDDAARIAAELQDKLTELDGKVAAYQRDLLAEFHRHMDECLRNCPDHVTSEVSRVIADSLSTGRYSPQSPARSGVPASPAVAIGPSPWDGRKSPPPVLPHTSGTPREGQRSPHAREKEFQGLFTPTYLPLLESNDRPDRSPPMSALHSAAEVPALGLALSIDNVSKVEEAKQPVAPGSGRDGKPPVVRRLTDRSTSSVESGGSDSKARRSALRRSSSSVKGSPRRVRFDVEGEEVFPASSSPKAPAVTSAAEALESGADTQPQAEPPVLATQDESIEYSGPSLLDIEGEEDLLPKPRKVSSTQALQALTRSPLDEGTIWTVVNPDTDEPAKMNGEKQSAAPQLATKLVSQERAHSEDKQINGFLGSPLEEEAANDDEEDEDASDEEFLSMRPKPKSPSPAGSTPFAPPPAKAPRTSQQPITNGKPPPIDTDESQDPLFDFDDEPELPSNQKYLPDDEEDDSDPDATPGRLRKAACDEAAANNNLPPVSPSSVLFSHSIGSYLGRSMTIAPIKDPKLYDEIAGMKDVEFFVGSIHDRSETDLARGSYSASARAHLARGATPRSFSERLAMEEEMERRRTAGEADDTF